MATDPDRPTPPPRDAERPASRPTTPDAEAEIARGERFAFGANWRRFLDLLDEARIGVAVRSLQEMLQAETLAGRRFLDIGCGSGLFSLAARRLGAEVRSLDYDPQSVACAAELKRRYFPHDEAWQVAQASVLDRAAMAELGAWDLVYSWGVLHHTGAMWQALDNVLLPLAEGGELFIALYNDQGLRSRLWRRVKRIYCSGALGKSAMVGLFFPYFALQGLAADLLRLRNPATRYREYRRRRGMSIVHDWHDWLGGLPFEVARPSEVVEFYRRRGLELLRQTTTRTLGNNQFVFRRPAG